MKKEFWRGWRFILLSSTAPGVIWALVGEVMSNCFCIICCIHVYIVITIILLLFSLFVNRFILTHEFYFFFPSSLPHCNGKGRVSKWLYGTQSSARLNHNKCKDCFNWAETENQKTIRGGRIRGEVLSEVTLPLIFGLTALLGISAISSRMSLWLGWPVRSSRCASLWICRIVGCYDRVLEVEISCQGSSLEESDFCAFITVRHSSRCGWMRGHSGTPANSKLHSTVYLLVFKDKFLYSEVMQYLYCSWANSTITFSKCHQKGTAVISMSIQCTLIKHKGMSIENR